MPETPTGIASKMGDKILEEAVPKITDKVYDQVKDKIAARKSA